MLSAGLGMVALRFGTVSRMAVAGQSFRVNLSDQEWRKKLTPDQYGVLREAGTEYPFTSPLLQEHRKGCFACAGCGTDLFASGTKYESRTGWPSFWAPLDDHVVAVTRDTSYGLSRDALHCTNCGGHLGHLFDDGPRPTGLRYCINGVALTFHLMAA